jgi:hypothetical protein
MSFWRAFLQGRGRTTNPHRAPDIRTDPTPGRSLCRASTGLSSVRCKLDARSYSKGGGAGALFASRLPPADRLRTAIGCIFSGGERSETLYSKLNSPKLGTSERSETECGPASFARRHTTDLQPSTSRGVTAGVTAGRSSAVGNAFLTPRKREVDDIRDYGHRNRLAVHKLTAGNRPLQRSNPW